MMKTKRIVRTLTTAFLLWPLALSAGELYRWVKPDGGVVYSTQKPPSTPVKIIHFDVRDKTTSANTVAPANAVAAENTKKEKVATSYTQLAISHPKNNQSFQSNAGNVSVTVQLEPPLDTESEHVIIITLDGNKKQRGQANSVTFMNVDRGQHTVQASIEDNEGSELIQSQSVTFQLHRFSKR